MKRITTTICLATLLFACNTEEKKAETKSGDAATSMSTTSSQARTTEWVPIDSATAMRTMMEAGTPGKEQATLAKDDGVWKAETTMWMSPDAPPMKSTSTVTNKMILDGRYQQSIFKGDMMGMPFEGMSTIGYDNARKVWVSSWVDNMSTGILTMEGTFDSATKTGNYSGKMFCPGNGQMCEIKQTAKMIDANTQLMEMYGPDMKTGKLYKNMEMKLTR